MMRKRVCFIGSMLIAVAVNGPILAAKNTESHEPFVVTLLSEIAFASSCRDEYDPSTAVRQHSMREGRMRKWEEQDRREPDTTNHMIEWVFPGFKLTTFTYFSWFGPSTWLHSLQLTSPTELPPPISFGQTSDEVLESLGNLDEKARSEQFWHESAYVTLDFGEDGGLQEVFLECIAD